MTIMKVIKLGNEVINIGDWDYCKIPMLNPEKVSEEDAADMISKGLDPHLMYDDGKLIMVDTNPYPVGAIESEEEVIQFDDGSRIAACDYKRLRKYPSIEEQLDYIYHNGVDKWKADMITPIKNKYPKS